MEKIMYRMELSRAGEFIYDKDFDSLEATYSHIIDSFYAYCDAMVDDNPPEIHEIAILFERDLSSKERATDLFNDFAAKNDGSYHKVTKLYVQS